MEPRSGFNLKKLSATSTDTARFPLRVLSEDAEKPITLIVRHAGRGNGEYVSALAKRPFLEGQELRESDASITARAVIVGWENVLEHGTPAAAEPAAFERFMLEWVQPRVAGEKDVDYDERINEYERFLFFVRNPGTFRAPIATAEDLGKG